MGMFPQVASSLVGGLFGMIGQNKQIYAQQRENDKAFVRTKALAEYQNRLNIEQWNRENLYNSPANKMKLLREAGLNPDLAIGGLSGMTSATSPTMSAGSPYQPADMTLGGNKKTLGDVVNESFNLAMQKKQLDLMQAQINKTNAETKGQELSNSTFLTMADADLRIKLADAGLKEEQIKTAIAERDQINKNIEQIDSNIRLNAAKEGDISFQQWLSKQKFELESREVEEKIKMYASQRGLTDAQTEQLKKSLPLVLEKLANDVFISDQQGNLLAGEVIMQASEQIILGNNVTLSNLSTSIEQDKLKRSKHYREMLPWVYNCAQFMSEVIGSTTGSIVGGIVKAIK